MALMSTRERSSPPEAKEPLGFWSQLCCSRIVRTGQNLRCDYCSRFFTDTGQYTKHPSGRGFICRSRAKCMGVQVIGYQRAYKKPGWLRRGKGILYWIEALQEPYMDRKAIQNVFQVSKTEAHRIIQDIGGAAPIWGNSKVISRESVKQYIQKKLKQENWDQTEETRVGRLVEKLNEAKRESKLKSRMLKVSKEVLLHTVAGLPGSIQLGPGILKIDYHGTEDLLRNLLELAMAIQNDFDRFESICESS